MSRKFAYWLDVAEYDLKTADAMMNSSRFLYVAFMCQQSLEKLAKGLYNFWVFIIPIYFPVTHL
jgi:HEPN domain-containing protein